MTVECGECGSKNVDEGANRFRPPNRIDVLYTAKQIREKIESYSKITEGKVS